MEIKCLIENTSSSGNYESEHGLSLFIRTEKHQLLFDFGASPKFIKNASAMDVDLSQIDIGILSHGHYDHSGGLESFLRLNDRVKVCVQPEAFEKHFSRRADEGIVNIGIEPKLSDNPQIYFVGRKFIMDKSLMVFSDIKEKALIPKGNQAMLVEAKDGTYNPDRFLHEQNLIVNENGKSILIAGCAHRGILNIVRKSAEYIGKMPDVVIGGFHLHSREESLCESPERIQQLGELLLQTGALYYTGHCTGEKAFHLLKEIMGEQIHYLSTGQTINL